LIHAAVAYIFQLLQKATDLLELLVSLLLLMGARLSGCLAAVIPGTHASYL